MASTMTAQPETDPGSTPEERGWWRTVTGWPRWGRVSLGVVAGLLALVMVLALAALLVVRRPLPTVEGTLEVPGLQSEVRVTRDDHGIPQIYASSMHDLLFAQGYVHAQERFFEMDMRRHYTAGRLSEVFGEATVETDELVRTLGWRRVAQRELALVSPDTRVALEEYADGVNAYLADHEGTDLAVEYGLLRLTGLDYTPEPWTPADSLSWLKAMAWDLRGNMDEEIARVLIGVDHTDAQVDQLYPPYTATGNDPILAGGDVVDGRFDADAGQPDPEVNRAAYGAAVRRKLAALQDRLDALPAPFGTGDGLGSNSWVVDGDRSATRAPIIANDPHLGVSLPGVWMQVGLHCAPVTTDCPLDVAGFSFSGVPGVIIGHNADIAWAFTNLGPDVTDLYLERLREGRWRHGGRWRPLATREETIEVAGGDDVELTVRSTDHGPVLSDVDSQLASVGANRAAADGQGQYAVSLAWTGLVPSTTADAILSLNLASNWSEFRAAARDFAVPSQNLLYADRDGHIGYQAPGLIPVRSLVHDGRTPAPGWKKAYDWKRWVPFPALPFELDPDEGFFVTANQRVVGGDYPYDFGEDMDHGYRSQRIRDLLEAHRGWTVDDMTRLQMDDHNAMAPMLVPRLLALRDLDSYTRSGVDLLRDWDFSQPADSAAAAYYNAVWANVLSGTFHDEIRESLWPEGDQRWFAVMTDLLERPDDPWWDDRTTDDVVETRDDILRAALSDARHDLTREQSPSSAEWAWGRDHVLDLEHPLGGASPAPVRWLVNRGPWAVGGGSSIVDAEAWDAASGDFTVTSAPSMRMVISLADFDASRWINQTGVSGHPASDHYVDQTDLWARGETLPWSFSSDAVDASAEHVLTLVPAS